MFKKLQVGTALIVGAILAIPLVAVNFLASQVLNLPFIPFDLFDWISRILPGPIITFGIDLMIDSLTVVGLDVADTAKTAEQMMAVSMFVGQLLLAGAILYALLRWREVKANLAPGLIAALLLGLPAMSVNIAISQSSLPPILRALWVVALFVVWGLAFNWLYARLNPAVQAAPAAEVGSEERMTAEALDRRSFLIRAGAGAAVITVVGAGVTSVLSTRERRLAEAGDSMAHMADEPPIGSQFPNAGDPVMPAPGTRPEYTPIKDHYSVFIRTEPSFIDIATWTLPITGLVEHSLRLTIDDIRNNYTPIDRYITLSCISGRLGTGLIGTTLWTGVSAQELLADAGIKPEAKYLQIHSVDGFYETVDLDLINSDDRIMFAYGWDGQPLPQDHGFPLRIYIPSRYGMKQPKWITSIDVIDEYTDGYWVERGWSKEAIMNTTSAIDTVAVDAVYTDSGQRYVPVGGIAHAGARGISKVEVRVDGGEWVEAQMRAPLSGFTWVIWRYDWPFEPGDHLFEVRCVDGEGNPQIEQFRDARPDGSTGIHSEEVHI